MWLVKMLVLNILIPTILINTDIFAFLTYEDYVVVIVMIIFYIIYRIFKFTRRIKVTTNGIEKREISSKMKEHIIYLLTVIAVSSFYSIVYFRIKYSN